MMMNPALPASTTPLPTSRPIVFVHETTETSRSIYNPIQRDRVTFLQTADESEGAQTLVEVELAPGGGNGLHYHRSFDERFTAVEGDLGVQIGTEKRTLRNGESVLAPRGTVHRFFNETDKPVRFLVEIAPGSAGFENALHVAYGLARDGHVNGEGMPTNPLALGLLTEWSDTRLVGPLALINPVMNLLARIGRRRGLDAALIVRYAPHTIGDIRDES